MKLNLKEKLDYKVITKDEVVGNITNFYFDTEKWKIRYIEADFGGLFTNKKYLIPVECVDTQRWKDDLLILNFKSTKLNKLEEFTEKEGISRKLEKQIIRNFNCSAYWKREFIPSMAPPSMGVPTSVFRPTQTRRIPNRVIQRDDHHGYLRSLKDLMLMDVFGKDGQVGKTTDLLIESRSWEIISFIVNIENKKEIILACKWVNEVSFVENGLLSDLPTEEITKAPTFNENAPVNEKQITKSYDFTGNPIN